ncbi:MAG: lysophospholipase [Myxococcaceae bacterium]|nr:lysophospholipase [Myxococcaceae bacterium]
MSTITSVLPPVVKPLTSSRSTPQAPAQIADLKVEPSRAAPIDVAEFSGSGIKETFGTFKGVKPYAMGMFRTSDTPPNLFYRRFMPEGKPRAAVVLLHGTGEHSGRYVEMARKLAKEGYAVFAYDQRGHGKSQGYRVYVKDFQDYTQDLNAFMKEVREQLPGAKVALYGHSLGALVAANYGEGLNQLRQPAPDAVVLSSPPLSELNVSPLKRMMAMVLGDIPVVDRNLVQNDIDVRDLSHDPSVVAAYEADELNEKFVTPSFGKAFIEAQQRALYHSNDFGPPVLALSSPDDQVAPQLNTPSFIEDGIRTNDKTLVSFPGAGHEIHNEVEPIKSAYYGHLISWLNKRFPAAQ